MVPNLKEKLYIKDKMYKPKTPMFDPLWLVYVYFPQNFPDFLLALYTFIPGNKVIGHER